MIEILGCNVDLGKFPDNTLLMKFVNYSEDIQIKWNYENDSELFTLICMAKHLRRIDKNVLIHLIMPYCPHARMDRVVSDKDVFTLKYFAEELNTIQFESVEIYDLHSSVAEALINNIIAISPEKLIKRTIDNIKNITKQTPVIYYPDGNACKKYSDMIKLPYVYGIKHRDWGTGKITGLEIIGDKDLILNKNILMIDDIISFGGSMHYGAMLLKNFGCKNIYAYATHVENSILDEKRGKLLHSGFVEKIYTTDSIYTGNHDKIEVYNI